MLRSALSAQSLLKQDYKDEITLEEAKALALKIMSKTMDSTKLGSEKRELFCVKDRSYVYCRPTKPDLVRQSNSLR